MSTLFDEERKKKYIYIYTYYLSIVFFLDGKIADRQTNNLSISPNGDCS